MTNQRIGDGESPGGVPPVDLLQHPSRVTLLRRFTLLSLGTTVLVGALLGFITARFVEDFALRRQARAVAEQVRVVLGTSQLGDVLLPASPTKTKIDSTVRSLVENAGIVSVTVWDPQGTAVLRDDAQWPGSAEPQSLLFARALTGELQWEPRTARSGVPQLAVLIPVRTGMDASTVAVYEVLYDLREFVPALVRVKWSVGLSIVLGVMSLYVALFSIVRRASHDLDGQQALLRRTYVGMIRSLINALDMRDIATAHHSSRVSQMAVAIARRMALNELQIHEVEVAAFLHDVGKIGIPDDVLIKPGALTHDERTIMELHSALGYEILAPVPLSEEIKLAVRHSHERWDGYGYPDGLGGEQIPLAARIVAVADAYEALVSNRPYRMARSPQQAIQEIYREAGTQFDPKVVLAFLRVWHDLQANPAGDAPDEAAADLDGIHEALPFAQTSGASPL